MVTAITLALLGQGKNKINEPGETGNMSETDVGLSELPDGWVWTTLEEVAPRLSRDSHHDLRLITLKQKDFLSTKA